MSFAGCWHRGLLCAAAALFLGTWALAQEPSEDKGKEKPTVKTAADKEFDRQVNQAIDKGVKFLRGIRQGGGGGAGSPAMGEVALVGLAWSKRASRQRTRPFATWRTTSAGRRSV